MMIKNVIGEELSMALARLNEKYDNNVIWNNYQREGRRFRVTLRVASSKGPGHRLGQSLTSTRKRRRLVNACWHVHGHFFEELLKINPEAVITTASGRIDKDGGNWVDRNIGSMYSPLYYSEACDCYSELEPNSEKV